MPADLLPLVLGTAYACLGLAGLRLARLDNQGTAWIRLTLAALTAALLEWYALYEAAYLEHQPNDLIGSLLALLSLAGFLEFSRRAISQRWHLGAVAQTFAGLLIAAAALLAVSLTHGGIYDRLVFSQRTIGLALAGLAILSILPSRRKGSAWTRAAGAALLAGILCAIAIPSAWPLAPGLALAAVFLRVLHAAQNSESSRSLGVWTCFEYSTLGVILFLAAASAHRQGTATIELEERQLQQITSAAAAALDPENIAELSGTKEDLDLSAYQMAKRRLLTIQKIARATSTPEKGSRFAYLMALRNGQVVFLADQPDDPVNPVSPGDIYHEASAQLRQSLHTGEPFLEGPLPDRYGSWVSAFAPIWDANGKLLALLGIDFDASDWSLLEARARAKSIINWTFITAIALLIFASAGLAMQSQLQLQRSSQMFRIAADYAAAWEYLVGTSGDMIYTSPACEKITGFKPAAFLHHPRRLLKITHPEDRSRLAKHLRSCARDAPACEFDFKIVRKDGAVAWISHTCQSVYDTEGRWIGRRASNRDITALRQSEARLTRLERLQAGCHQALRRFLGRDGSRSIKEALEMAAQAAGCSCAGLFDLEADRTLRPLEVWPAAADCLGFWLTIRDRALPILSIGESFELLPVDTADLPAPLRSCSIVILPMMEPGDLAGVAIFAVPATREPWSKSEVTALATLTSGLSAALSSRN